MHKIKTTDRYYKELILAGLIGVLSQSEIRREGIEGGEMTKPVMHMINGKYISHEELLEKENKRLRRAAKRLLPYMWRAEHDIVRYGSTEEASRCEKDIKYAERVLKEEK